MDNINFGAFESHKDSRTVQHSDLAMATTPLIKGGFEYLPADIENQAKVGICTAISLIQNREKANGKRYSADFQYLLQKKYYDLNWTEGSCILNALKVGKKYGFLPVEKWTITTQADRNLPYAQYIAKLQAVPDATIQNLLTFCVDAIPGYAQVDITDSQAVAKAIDDSNSGILCRFDVGSEWYFPSWREKDISPLRPPKSTVSGHAIGMTKYDYTVNTKQVLANTWGVMWCRNGSADIIWDNYKPTEAWVILGFTPKIKPLSDDPVWWANFLNLLKFLRGSK